MRPSQVVEALRVYLTVDTPVMLHGSPGIGKSQMVHQVAEEMFEGNMIDLRLSQLDPVDLRGVPSIVNKQTTWNPPDFLPQKGKGILFLDEMNSAAQATLSAAYQLVLDRKVGDYRMPEGWRIVAAGNRVQDRAMVNVMPTALRNRMGHIDVEVNNDDWGKWALTHDIHPGVLAFLRFKPSALNEMDETGDKKRDKEAAQRLKDAQAFATPRTWEYVSRMITQGVPEDIQLETLGGLVGAGAAAEFIGYMKVYQGMPNLDALLMNPTKARVPEEPAVLYALATGLAVKATEDNFDRVLKYADRMQPEFQILLVKDAVTRSTKLANTKPFNEWSFKNANVLL